jgi:hypothetical protein
MLSAQLLTAEGNIKLTRGSNASSGAAIVSTVAVLEL